MKRARESDGVPTPRRKLNGSSRSATYADRSSKPVSYTQANFDGGRGTGQLQNWLASVHPGAYTSRPHPSFGAKDVCYIEKKVAK